MVSSEQATAILAVAAGKPSWLVTLRMCLVPLPRRVNDRFDRVGPWFPPELRARLRRIRHELGWITRATWRLLGRNWVPRDLAGSVDHLFDGESVAAAEIENGALRITQS